ncbi:universal stress protein [Marmoricola sp. URHB0036]|uniref:universal stress protein n=1 Tax=Marmoricola sp. URHB0036 TaxID=1298863 RepID=UPI000400771A|nr:universal stress protein [Marmoricola sp. URHB0036]
MTNNQHTAPVAVGVDETPAAQKGVQYAALEARRISTRLSVLHVTPGYTPAAGLPAVPEDVLRSYGFQLLEHARKHAQTVVPELEVETNLVTGNTSVQALAGSSDEASLLVLGAERRSFAGRVWTGDIVAGVAARAACPVVVVAPEWEPTHEHGRIVVGVKDPEHAGDLVGAGLALADELGAELVVLHAWKAPSGYDDIIVNRTEGDEYARRQRDLLDGLVQAGRDEHPDVKVRTEVVHAQAAHALVNASADADRLLISRPRHGLALHHLGNVARALLNEARCPLEVHPAGETAPRP